MPTGTLTPFVKDALLRWTEEAVFPAVLDLLKQDDKLKNELLNSLSGNTDPTTVWTLKDKQIPFIYVNANKVEVNLRNLSIVSAGKRQPNREISAKMPTAAFDRFPELNALMKSCSNYKCLEGDNVGETIFSFTSKEGDNYQVRSLSHTGQVILCRQIDGKWFQKIYPKEAAFGGAALAKDLGIWMSIDDPTKGKIFLSQLPHKLPVSEIDIEFTKEGTFKGAFVTYEDKKQPVDFSSKGHKTAFPIAYTPHCIYLPEANELIFLDQGIVAKKNQLNNWTIRQPDKFKNLALSRALRTETESSKRANIFVKALGPDLAMHLNSEESDHLILWPRAITRTKTGEVSATPIQEPTQAAKMPLVNIRINADGGLEGSAADFLYLAYVLMQKREYALANKMLTKAQNSRLETDKDKQLFATVTELIRQEDPKTTRSMAFQLSAEVALLDIEKQQLSQSLFNPSLRSEYFDNVHHLSVIYGRYTDRKAEAIGLKKPLTTEHDLSAEVNEKCLAFRKEGFAEILQSGKIKYKSPIEQTLKTVDESDLSPTLLSYIALNSDLNEDQDIPPPVPFTSEYVLKYFCRYYNDIVTGRKQSRHVQFLFDPLMEQREDRVLTESEQAMVKAADTARRILAEAVLLKDTDLPLRFESINITELAQIQNKIPNKIEKLTKFGLIKGGFEALKTAKSEVPRNEGESLTKWLKRVGEKGEEIYTKKLLKFGLDDNAVNFIKQIYTPIQSLLTQAVPKLNSADIMTPTSIGFEKNLLAERNVNKETEFNVKHTLANFEEISKELGLSELEKMGLKTTLEKLKADGAKTCNLRFMIEAVEAMSLSLVDMRRQEVLRNEAQQLEREVILASDQIITDQNFKSTALDKTVISFGSQFQLDNFFGAPDQAANDRAATVIGQMQTTYNVTNEQTAVEKAENSSMLQGTLELLNKRIIPESELNRTFKAEGRKELGSKINGQLDASVEESAAKKFKDSKAQILKLATESNIPSLKKMIDDHLLYSHEEIIEEVLRLYQIGHPLINQHEKTITEFLLLGTSVQQLQNAAKLLNNIDKLTDPETIKEETRKLCQILRHNLNTTRYLKDNALDNSKITRKFLVAEYSMGIVLQQGQREAILKICKNPTSLSSLRMGEGKSFIIMPLIAAIMADEYLPVMLSPAQFETSSQAETDRTTNRIFGRRAHAFKVELNKTHSAAYLAGIYRDMLQVRKRKDYLTSTVPALASLQSLSVQLRDEQTKLLNEIRNKAKAAGLSVPDFLSHMEDPEIRMLAYKLKDTENRLHWVRKISRLLDGSLEVAGETQPKHVKTLIFGDEVDSICHIQKEINRASGEKVPIDKDIRKMGFALFDVLLSVPDVNPNERLLNNHEFEAIKKLRDAFMNGTQATFSELPPKVFKKEYLMPLVKFLLANPEVSKNLPQGLARNDELYEFLTEFSEKQPASIKWDASATGEKLQKQISLSAIKHLIAITVPSMCTIEGGLRLKMDSERGCLGVPADQGRKVKGNRFGDEYELVALQYLAHIQVKKTKEETGKTTDFYINSIRKCQDVNKDLFKALQLACGVQHLQGEELFTAMAQKLIDEPKLWRERLALVDQAIFEGGLVERNEEMITVEAASVASGRDFGGITGTLNPYSAPGFKVTTKDVKGQAVNVFEASARQVEAETFLKAAMNHPEGMNQTVSTLHDTEPVQLAKDFEAIIKDDKTVAIVNEGNYGLEGRSIEQWISELRKMDPTKNFGWAVEVQEPNPAKPDEMITITKYFLWKANESQSKSVSKSELTALPFIGIYTAEFTRGTDLPLGTGNVHYLPSRTTNPQDAGQSIWRGRGTGARHTTVYHIPQSIAKTEHWNIAQVDKWITRRGVQEQTPLNLKAQNLRIKELAACPVRQFLNSLADPELDGTTQSLDKANLQTSYAYMVGNDVLNQHFRDYSVKKKTADFAADLAPAKQDKTVDVIKGRYNQELTKAKNKSDALPELMLNTFHQLAADAGMADVFVDTANMIVNGSQTKRGLLEQFGINRSYVPTLMVDLLTEPENITKSPEEKLRILKKKPIYCKKP